MLDSLGPVYHNYRFFGVDNKPCNRVFELNQLAKEPIIRAYVALALAKAGALEPQQPSFLEMFCADGYYTMLAAKLGAGKAVGVDSNQDGHLDLAPAIAAALKVPNTHFLKMDVHHGADLGTFDVVANIGGLYHVADPEDVLDLSYRMARHFLVVQTVVSLANRNPDYFETPAPGWTWGCRYSYESFHKSIMARNWTILDHHFNRLPGNPRAEDKGSSYYLVAKQAPGDPSAATPPGGH